MKKFKKIEISISGLWDELVMIVKSRILRIVLYRCYETKMKEKNYVPVFPFEYVDMLFIFQIPL